MWHIRTPPKPQHAGQNYRAQQQLDARQANYDLRTYNLVPHLPHLQPSLEYFFFRSTATGYQLRSIGHYISIKNLKSLKKSSA